MHDDYQSYGKLEGDVANPSLSNPFTYTGREDDGTGLIYYRARYYDPELEAFISQDPLGDAQRYVAGNPLVFFDPMGLALLFTDMKNGITTFYPGPEGTEWSSMTIPSLNSSVSRTPGSNGPFTSGDSVWTPSIPSRMSSCPGRDAHQCYGPNGSYIHVDPVRGRDIHGGGTRLGMSKSQQPVQPLVPTMGCTRGHNTDVKDLGQYIDIYKKAHPGVKVPYIRSQNPDDGSTELQKQFNNWMIQQILKPFSW